MIVIIDYKINNLISIYNTVKNIYDNTIISDEISNINKATKLILPGVGTFKEGMKYLNDLNLINVIRKRVLEEKIPILGICLGMQLLAGTGYEVEKTNGINLIPGVVKSIPSRNKNNLHIGWNEITILKENKLFENIKSNEDVYFVHSFHFIPDEKSNIVTMTESNINLVSSINHNNIYGVQFHPEKSGRIGKEILKNFIYNC